MAWRLHPGYSHKLMREWQDENAQLGPSRVILPVFVTDKTDVVEPIPSLPGVSRFSVDKLKNFLGPLVQKGLKSVLLFGVTDQHKDARASYAERADSPVVLAVKLIRQEFPDVLVACDVCMCGYTDHGHCGILFEDGSINNPESIIRIGQIALGYAKAGAHLIAPSDMMDGRIGAIKEALKSANLEGKVAVMSYAAKFASCFYGPFRDAACSSPQSGDRQAYQLPVSARGLAIRAVERDIQEGADFVMVKPSLAFMDIIRDTDNKVNVPVAAYQVSGEYSMLWWGAEHGAFDLKAAVLENLACLRRAGASIVITYFVPSLLDWWKEE